MFSRGIGVNNPKKKKTALLSMQYFPVKNHLSMRDLLGEKISLYAA